MTYKVGQKVRILVTDTCLAGTIGEVKEVYDGIYVIFAKKSDGFSTKRFYEERELGFAYDFENEED